MMALRISITINVICIIIIVILAIAEAKKKKWADLKKCRSNAVMWLAKIYAATNNEQLDVLKGLIEKDIHYFKTVLPVDKVDREFENISDAFKVKSMQFKKLQ